MDNMKNKFRHATSAGYRLPDRPTMGVTSHSAVYRQHLAKVVEASKQNPDTLNQVKQDQLWRDLVRAERVGVTKWQRNWSFLKNTDQLGYPRKETPLPSYVPMFSDRFPNTTNQTFGSRLHTDNGQSLIRLDRMLSLRAGHQKTKMSPEMRPF